MVTKCSSVNSVLFYAPWMYLSVFSASFLGVGAWALPSAIALLQLVFGAVYEFQGPRFGWWAYGDESVAGGALNDRWHGMPSMGLLFHPALGFGFGLAANLHGYNLHAFDKKSRVG